MCFFEVGGLYRVATVLEAVTLNRLLLRETLASALSKAACSAETGLTGGGAGFKGLALESITL